MGFGLCGLVENMEVIDSIDQEAPARTARNARNAVVGDVQVTRELIALNAAIVDNRFNLSIHVTNPSRNVPCDFLQALPRFSARQRLRAAILPGGPTTHRIPHLRSRYC